MLTSPSSALLANIQFFPQNCCLRTCSTLLGHNSSPCLSRETLLLKKWFCPQFLLHSSPPALFSSTDIQGHHPLKQRGWVALGRNVLNLLYLQPAGLPGPLVTSSLTFHAYAYPAEERRNIWSVTSY